MKKAMELQARINRVQMTLAMSQMTLNSLANWDKKYQPVIEREAAAAARLRDHLQGLMCEYEREVSENRLRETAV